MTTTTDLNIDRVRGGERIASLDVLRGIAILFILVMNIPWMGGYEFTLWDPRHPTWSNADYWTTLITKTWLEGTQRGLLELLFGAGIMIMARKAMTPAGPVAVADLHYRRNLWLIVFGLANAFVLLWPGDILLVYGLAAILLFPFRTMSPKHQIGFAALLLGALLWHSAANYRADAAELDKVERIGAAQAAGKALNVADKDVLKEHRKDIELRTRLPARSPDSMKKIAEADKARHGDFQSYWWHQAEGWKFIMSAFFWFIEAEIMATMLIGMALFQIGIIQGRSRTSTYWALLLAGYGFGLAVRGSLWFERLSFTPPFLHWQEVIADIARLAVVIGHVALVHLALRSRSGRALLKPFEAAGRMPLTVYLFTSFLMMWVIFAPWGLDLFGRFGMAILTALALAVIAAEIVAANLWLRHYENGPLEWLWKSLAYERREPFRKRATAPAEPLPSPL